jgi:uncharacterized membrane protein YqaE (UPF0057 family)
MKLIKLILAIVAPPLAVLLERGVGGSLLLNILLTILAWLPGAIHALFVVMGHQEPMPSTVRV